jgi:hypothetical protein
LGESGTGTSLACALKVGSAVAAGSVEDTSGVTVSVAVSVEISVGVTVASELEPSSSV